MNILRFSTFLALSFSLANPLFGMKAGMQVSKGEWFAWVDSRSTLSFEEWQAQRQERLAQAEKKAQEEAAAIAASPQLQLLDAIQNGNLEEVQRILNLPMIPEQGVLEGIWLVAPVELARLAEEYVKPINVNDFDDNGQTPLIKAIKAPQWNPHYQEILVELLRRADVFLCDEHGCSPLTYAALFAGINFTGNAIIISALIDAQNLIDKAKSQEYIKATIQALNGYIPYFKETDNDPDKDKIIQGLKNNLKVLEAYLEK